MSKTHGAGEDFSGLGEAVGEAAELESNPNMRSLIEYMYSNGTPITVTALLTFLAGGALASGVVGLP